LNGGALDRPGIIAPPPLLALGCLAIGLVVDRFVPLPIAGSGAAVRVGIAIALLIAAAALFLAAVRQFRKHDTTPNPYQPSSAIVSSGVFGFTRNPIYVAFMLVVLSAGVGFNTLWPILGLVPLALVLHFGVVRREERYLSRKFGNAYDDYRRRVRRWI